MVIWEEPCKEKVKLHWSAITERSSEPHQAQAERNLCSAVRGVAQAADRTRPLKKTRALIAQPERRPRWREEGKNQTQVNWRRKAKKKRKNN